MITIVCYVLTCFCTYLTYSICGIGTSRSWQPEGRRLARSNPRLVARHTYSSRLPAQTLTALTIGAVGVPGRTGSGLNRVDGGEDTEKKISPQVSHVIASSGMSNLCPSLFMH